MSTRRPRVVCHMGVSVDRRIVVDGWPSPVAGALRREYEAVHASYEAHGWMCGRVTMEPFAGGVRAEAEVARDYAGGVPREDFVAQGEYDSFAFAVDASGRLAWESNDIDGDHVVAIVDEVSVLIAPVADGRFGTPTLFDGDVAPRRLALESVERRAGDVCWLRYRVEKSPE